MKSALALAALALTGCATSNIDLPEITAREVFVSHQNPLFNVSINGENVVDHGTYVTADKITYERGGRITSTVIRVEGYRREKATPAQAPVSTPAQVATPPPSSHESTP